MSPSRQVPFWAKNLQGFVGTKPMPPPRGRRLSLKEKNKIIKIFEFIGRLFRSLNSNSTTETMYLRQLRTRKISDN